MAALCTSCALEVLYLKRCENRLVSFSVSVDIQAFHVTLSVWVSVCPCAFLSFPYLNVFVCVCVFVCGRLSVCVDLWMFLVVCLSVSQCMVACVCLDVYSVFAVTGKAGN